MWMIRTVLLAVLVGTLAVGAGTLAGCDNDGPDDGLGGQWEEAGEETGEAFEETGEEAWEATEEAGEETGEAIEETGD